MTTLALPFAGVRRGLFSLCALGTVVLHGCAAQHSATPAVPQRTFDTPEDAVVALIDAARTGDIEAVRPLFGTGFEELESDSIAVTEGDLQRLAAAYDRRHALFVDDAASGSGSGGTIQRVTLAVGDDLWEFPVPLVRDGAPAQWRFDTAAGVEAVWAMRCERNEAEAIVFLLECIPAQEEYRQLGVGGPNAFARRFRSEPGTRNGLWWPDEMGPPRSPLGPMADESLLGANPPIDPRTLTSYRGYRYRVLEAAGPSAPGGSQRWLDSQGRLIGGFAFLAWPEEYGRSGVHTMLVSMDGSVWIADLGPQSGAAAGRITSLDPGTGWARLDVE